MTLSQFALRAPSISRGMAERATSEPEGLVGIGIIIQTAPRQTIVLEGDPCSHCFRVLTGTVCLYKATIDGRRQLIDFLVAGDCFGLFGVRYTYSVEAITRSTLVRASRATLAAAVREHPGMAERLIEYAAVELARVHEQMLLLGRKNALAKVASLLVDLARRLGANPTGPAFRLPISRQEMADQLGLTIETVSRTMTCLKERGFITLPTPHDITLQCLVDLAALAEGAASGFRRQENPSLLPSHPGVSS